jgi:FrmR/RcnR family transcriptional regulator, repressor of frmRAB operon
MAHTRQEKEKLVNRVRRIRGQLNAVEASLEEDADCSVVLQTLAATRGAMDGLLFEIIQGHIRSHVVDPDRKSTARQAAAVEELIDVLRVYLK